MAEDVTEISANFTLPYSDRNDLDLKDSYDVCGEDLPTTAELLGHFPTEGHILAGLLVFFSLLTLIVYIDEIIFIKRRFRRGTRTMWVLACYPVYSVTGLLAIFIPRCGVVNDMIASGFFATCLYNFGRLMVRYMGGTKHLCKIFNTDRLVSFRTVPICCCFFCLPLVPFRMPVYNAIRGMVMQVAVIRPILTFIAVVLYVDGTFKPGRMSYLNPYSYIMFGDIASTMLAVYGLMILRGVFQPELEHHFKLSGKIMSIQLALIGSILPNIIIGILVSNNVIKCGPVFPSKARGEMIYHVVVVLIMLPLSLLAQRFFRRSSDSESYFERKANMIVLTVTDGDRDSGDLSTSEVKNGTATLALFNVNDETNV